MRINDFIKGVSIMTALAFVAAPFVDGMALIPQPAKIKTEAGAFTITPQTKIIYMRGNERLADAANYLASRLSLAFDRAVTPEPGDAVDTVPGAILMTTAGADPALGDEGYQLEVGANGVLIRAPQAAGAFYGGITLLQLAPPQAFRAPAMVEGRPGGTQTVPPPRRPSHGTACGHRCVVGDPHTCGGALGIPPRARAPWGLQPPLQPSG